MAEILLFFLLFPYASFVWEKPRLKNPKVSLQQGPLQRHFRNLIFLLKKVDVSQDAILFKIFSVREKICNTCCNISSIINAIVLKLSTERYH